MVTLMQGTIDIVIVTFNSSAHITSCLQALSEASNQYRVRITVVDNGSTDNTIQVVENFSPIIEVIHSGANIGYAGGNNLAIRKIQESSDETNAILLLNPDVELSPLALDSLMEVLYSSS